MNKNEIIQIQGMEYKEMTKQLLNECALATLIPSRVSLIGIKPNLVAPVPAEFGGTTHPEVVADHRISSGKRIYQPSNHGRFLGRG